MSFLNPVNEPVLRFSSTDAGALQLNFATRTEGDVKAILKACLVTGYGAKASAGWTIANETASYGEFTSPSAAMSDLMFSITDNAANNTWAYKKSGVAVRSMTENKAMSGVTHVHPDNGWEVLVTERGFFYIEMAYAPDCAARTARLFYFGAVKSALEGDSTGDAGLWGTGWGVSLYPSDVFKNTAANTTFRVNNANSTQWISASFHEEAPRYNVSAVDVLSDVFVINSGATMAQHPGMLAVRVAKTAEIFGVRDTMVSGRPALYVTLTNNFGSPAAQLIAARFIVIYLDIWEY